MAAPKPTLLLLCCLFVALAGPLAEARRPRRLADAPGPDLKPTKGVHRPSCKRVIREGLVAACSTHKILTRDQTLTSAASNLNFDLETLKKINPQLSDPNAPLKKGSRINIPENPANAPDKASEHFEPTLAPSSAPGTAPAPSPDQD